jgi:hypothetical protein
VKKLSAILTVLLALGFASLAQAQATRTWVSGVGDDVNPCSRTAPCKTFAGAISKTASPGIINCLDPGGFGAVTITKGIEIDCTGTLGSVLHSGVQGIVVNALTTDDVVLRALAVNGSGTTLGTNGINIIQARSVSIYQSNFAKVSGNEIQLTNSSNTIKVVADDVEILNCGGAGILTNTSGTGHGTLVVSNSVISRCANGIDIGGAANTVFVDHSVVSHNTLAGVQIQQSTSNGFLESSGIYVNGTGVQAGTGGGLPNLRISRSTIYANTSNGIGGGGTTVCFGNNVIAANGGVNACTNPNTAQQ